MRHEPDDHETLRAHDDGAERLLDLIHLVQQAGERLFLSSCEQPDITARQHRVLQAIAREPSISQTRIVALTGIDRSTLSDIVRRMASRGWCTRKRSRYDARAYGVQLTNPGADALRNSTRASDVVENRLVGIVGESQRAVLAGLLNAIAEALARDPARPAVGTTSRRGTRSGLAKSRS